MTITENVQAPGTRFHAAKMDPLYLIACAVQWRNTAGKEAGRELGRALASPDALTRCLAESLLGMFWVNVFGKEGGFSKAAVG
jgi:hypothetical protein